MNKPIPIAIIGMAGRFPGASDLEQFRIAIRDGCSRITYFDRAAALAAGINPATVDHPDYVPANGVLAEADCFDAGFFGYLPREAEQIDPQQRVFLECAWHALEDAGYAPGEISASVGVFGGSGYSAYQLQAMADDRQHGASGASFQRLMGNDKDYLTTRVSYKLNLTGPSLAIGTACSTSLVAVHMACQSLLHGECEMALAGGVKVNSPQLLGHVYQEGSALSRDGSCQPFSEAAVGVSAGNGVGILVLKPLQRALEDGDDVKAIILGSAVNNDGIHKIGYTAPSKDGQVQVIAEALAVAGVDPDSIGYIEAHGTATALGDALELGALTTVFGAGNGNPRCALGSVKSQIGHLDSAAGAASLIKGVLLVQSGEIPPAAGSTVPHPDLAFASSPFFLSDRLSDWPITGSPRRVGVSSFGVGGTNAHLVLEQSPPGLRQSVPGSHWLPLSARDPDQLRELVECYLRWLEDDRRDIPLSDIAFTAGIGRVHQPYRRGFVATDRRELIERLRAWLHQGAVPALCGELSMPIGQLDLRELGVLTGAQARAAVAALAQRFPAFARGAAATPDTDGDPRARICTLVAEFLGNLLGLPGGALLPAGLDGAVNDAVTPQAEAGRLFVLAPPADDAALLRLLSVAYESGLEVDFGLLYQGLPVRRASLPGYPFARDHYYIGPGLATDRILELEHWWQALLEYGHDWVEREQASLQPELYPQRLADLEALSCAYIALALQALGAFPAGGERYDVDEFVHRHGIRSQYRQLARRLLSGLADHAWLQQDRHGYWDLEVPSESERADLLRRHREQWGCYAVMSETFPKLGESLAGILRGDLDTRELYFPDGKLDQALDVYADLPTSRFYNGLLGAVVERWWVQRKSPRLRVLEIGAGTGATSAVLLPQLGSALDEYCFTDVSTLFLRHAEQRFSAYPSLRCQLLDIEKDPVEQGVEAGVYDLVVASNALHVAGDIRQALSHARRLLKPQGLLLLYEITANSLHGDITTGLLLDPVRDPDLRGDKPFMAPEQWRRAAFEVGYARCHWLPDAASPAAVVGEHLLLLEAGPQPAGRETAAQGGVESTAASARPVPEARHFDGIATHGDLYRTTWCMMDPLLPAAAGVAPRDHVLVGYRAQPLAALCRALRSAGHRAQGLLLLGEQAEDEVLTCLESVSASALSRALADCRAPERDIDLAWLIDVDPGLPLEELDGPRLQQHAETVSRHCLGLVAALDDLGWTPRRTLMITRMASACHDQEHPDPTAALQLGLLRVIARGHPELALRIRDVETGVDAEILSALLQDGEHDAPWLALRGDRYWEPRLEWVPAEPVSEIPAIDPNARYLLIGGLGGVGLAIAGWLVARGARHLLLANRTLDKPQTHPQLEALREQGADVVEVMFDVADAEQVQRLIQVSHDDVHPLKGVFNCAAAGGWDDARLATEERLHKVLDPKVSGSWNLHRATRDLDLDYFLLCSSVVTQTPVTGLPDYAAANQFCEALAEYRRGHGLPALAVAWGSWAEVGAVATDPLRERLARQGLAPLSTAAALELLERAVSLPGPVYGAMQMDWQRQLSHYGNKIPTYFAAVADTDRTVTDEPVRERLRQAQPEARPDLLSAYLLDRFAELLRLDAASVGLDDNLIELGLDSLMFLDVTAILGQDLGIKISPRELYEHSSLRAMTAHLLPQLDQNGGEGPGMAVATAHASEAPGLASYYQPEPEAALQPFPLTDMQQAYWLGRQSDFELGNVSAHGYIELEGSDWDMARLEQAWRQVIARHAMLRAVVCPNAMQQVLPSPPPYNIPVIDLRDLEEAQQAQQLNEIRHEMAHQVHDLGQWPLFDLRITLLADECDARGLKSQRKRLHFSLDNIMMDGRSLNVFVGEWVHFYTHPDEPLPALNLSFRDYVLAEQRFQQSQAYEVAWQYWAGRLATLPAAPALPLAKAPDQIAQPRFERHGLRMEAQRWEQVKRRARQYGLTPSGLLLACYAEVLAVWSNQRHFTLNLPTFNRLPIHPDVNQVVGEFTSILLVEVDFRGQSDFVARARRIQQQILDDLARGGYVSGIAVLRALGRQRGGPRRALMPVVFSSMFGLGNETDRFDYDFSAIELFGRQVYAISQTPQVWLDNHIHESRDGLNIYWDEVAELFPSGLVTSMFEAYCRLLSDLVDDESCWLNPWPVSLPADQQGRLADYNATRPVDSGSPPTLLLHELFQRQVAERGDQPAILCRDKTLTYNELQARTTALAGLLRAFGARPGDLVAIVMDKGWQQAVAALAVLEAGAAYVPIEANLPSARRELLLEQSAARLALTQRRWLESLSWPQGLQVFDVDNCNPVDDGTPPLLSVQQDDALAYVIYTSGSTGVPKGVMIDHRGAVNTVLDVNRRFKIGPEDRVLALSAFGFDLSVYDLFGLLAAGGALVIPDADRGRDPIHWGQLMAQYGVSVWNTVPTLLQMLLEGAAGADLAGTRMRRLLVSGDWVPLALPDQCRKIWPEAALISLGGATEASIWSIFHAVDEVAEDWTSIPYGRPLSGQSVHVLDQDLNPCPEWVTGDLYIGGAGLAMGYWRDPAKTDERFIHNPRGGERLYHTGDIGRLRPEGWIEFQGRNDFQVKIRGHRIELGEIETQLRRQPGVRDALVGTLGSDRRLSGLVAYLLAEETGILSAPDWLAPETVGARSCLAAWERALASARPGSEAGPVRPEDAEALWDGLQQMYVNAVTVALHKLAVVDAPLLTRDDGVTFEDLHQHSGIVARYAPWLRRALGVLVAEGLLIHDAGQRYRLSRPLPDHLDKALWQRAESLLRSALGYDDEVVRQVYHTVSGLASLLTESESASDMYVSDATEAIYAHQFDSVNRRLTETVLAYASARALPVDAEERPRLRILEIGAGFGTSAVMLLSALQGYDYEYWFTDVSPYFVGKAREAFAEYPWVRFATFDMDRSPSLQGLPAHHFDIVLSASVLHVATDATLAVRHCQQLLRAGGVLLAIEEMRFHPWADLEMGLQPGFERFQDHDLRPDHPLLSGEQWAELCRGQGFIRAESLVEEKTWEGELGIGLILAQGPDQTPILRSEVLRRQLSRALPDYMLPDHYYLLDAWPLGSTGKLDRHQLPRPEPGERHSGSGDSARGEAEQMLAQAWQVLLDLPAVGRESHFFELGGDSLLATRLVNWLHDAGYQLPLHQVFAEPILYLQALALQPIGQAETIVMLHEGLADTRQAPPLFWVHAADGGIQGYQTLCKAAQLKRRCYGIQLDPRIRPATLQHLATYYVQLIEQRWPRAPLQLAGFSSGGMLAWLVARQLEARGYALEPLCLIDSQFVSPGLEKLRARDWLDGYAIAHGLDVTDAGQDVAERQRQLAEATHCSMEELDRRLQVFQEQTASIPRRPEVRLNTRIRYIQAKGAYGADAAQLRMWQQASQYPLELFNITCGHFDCFRHRGLKELVSVIPAALERGPRPASIDKSVSAPTDATSS